MRRMKRRAIVDPISPESSIQRQYTNEDPERYRAISVRRAIRRARRLSLKGKIAYMRETMLADTSGRVRTSQDFKYRDTEGRLHREGGPAVIRDNGTRWWFHEGKTHRADGPAVICADGTQEWYRKGEMHREDGPAYIHADGTQEWWLDGNLHREDGPAVIEADGEKIWFWHNQAMSEVAIWLRAGHPFTVDELTELALSDDEAEREGALNHPDCPEHVRVFVRVAV